MSYNEIKYNKGKICLICVDLYQRLFNEPQINYMNIDVNLLKINKVLYIYFHKIKKFAKLINKEQIKNSIHDNNIWSEVLLNKEDEEKKNQIIKELNINENIIKKIFLISQQKNTINNIIKGKEIIEIKDYSLINRKWLEKYKEHDNYNYHLILKQLSDISIEENDYTIYKTKFENDNINMKFNKLPDELKKPENVLPQIQKYLSYEFPNEFDIIKLDLFNLLMKEETPNDNYYLMIDTKKQKNYRILLGNQLLILVNDKFNYLLIYSIKSKDNKKNYNQKFVIEFNDAKILNEQFQLFKT